MNEIAHSERGGFRAPSFMLRGRDLSRRAAGELARAGVACPLSRSRLYGLPVRYNGGMKRAVPLAIVLVLLQPAALLCGCGGEAPGIDEEVAMFAIENILIPELRDEDFILGWMRQPTGIAETSRAELGLRFWKWEGGVLAEISLEEYERLAALREGGDARMWTYSQHSVTVLEADAEEGRALVEVGSLYGPLTGSGTRYLLRKGEEGWKKVSEQTVWTS